MESALEQTIALQKKFNIVFREIIFLESKINEKRGFWFFETHVYSKETLFNSEHHSKIDSITEKIGSDVISWNKFGKLTEEGRSVYENMKKEVNDKLEEVGKIIANREPTWWEGIESFFVEFIHKVVINNMPEILIENLAFPLFSKIPILSGVFKRIPKLLGGR
ncbi:hypothetical protein [Calothrix sp. PCC 6303]|uniref:hypothetical protein n=1 Tax=Calothrix sp. PCC 6303 TaxID=1170562 RepID=UPI0002A00B63|nr:hypothetical protein [Calothrix sp. PCC 6303]AFZ02968.1 hypothetical protein Cal6303_4052 [Calothrix sp. PCC 6303]